MKFSRQVIYESRLPEHVAYPIGPHISLTCDQWGLQSTVELHVEMLRSPGLVKTVALQ